MEGYGFLSGNMGLTFGTELVCSLQAVSNKKKHAITKYKLSFIVNPINIDDMFLHKNDTSSCVTKRYNVIHTYNIVNGKNTKHKNSQRHKNLININHRLHSIKK